MFCEVQNVVLLTEMALMSLVCPVKVCLQAPSLRSHSLARESQAPEMKVFMSGDSASDIQSPMWLVKIIFCLPVSRSHRQLVNRGEERVMSELILAWLWKKKSSKLVFHEKTHQVVSPEAVRISVSLMKRQQDRYPVCGLYIKSLISCLSAEISRGNICNELAHRCVHPAPSGFLGWQPWHCTLYICYPNRHWPPGYQKGQRQHSSPKQILRVQQRAENKNLSFSKFRWEKTATNSNKSILFW